MGLVMSSVPFAALLWCSPELGCQSSQTGMSEDSKQTHCLGAAHLKFLNLGNGSLELCISGLW